MYNVIGVKTVIRTGRSSVGAPRIRSGPQREFKTPTHDGGAPTPLIAASHKGPPACATARYKALKRFKINECFCMLYNRYTLFEDV